MVKTIGRRVEIGLGKETTRGTVIAPTAWVPKASLDFDEKMEVIADESSIGLIADSTNAEIVKRWAEGTYEMVPGVNALSLLLLSTLGTVSSAITGAGSVAYKHTFTVANNNTHPSLTISVKDAIASKAFALSMIESLMITVEPGQFVKIAAAFKGKKSAVATLTSTYAADYPLLAKMANLFFATNTAGLGAAQARTVRKFEITFTKNLADEYCLGSVEPADINNQQFMVEGSLEATYEDQAAYETDALNGTIKAMRLKIEDTGTDISGNASSARPSLIITCPRVKFMEWGRTQGNDEIIKQTVGFKGLYSTADTSMVTAELINTITSL